MINQKLQNLRIINRYSIIGSVILFILFFSACTNPYKNLTKSKLPENNIKNIPYLLPHSEKAIIYKADITFYKNNLSGLLVIKKMEEENYRIALTTQFGLKIFDFELNHGKLNVVFCIDQLNRNMIIKTFEEAFNVLLLQESFDHIYEARNSELNQKIWLLNSGKFNTYCIQNQESISIDNINKTKRNSKKISVGLLNYKNDLPGEINLEHHSIKFKMNLKFLQ
jgi:PBP1b-binding outer membrane lipoprotein LpoB